MTCFIIATSRLISRKQASMIHRHIRVEFIMAAPFRLWFHTGMLWHVETYPGLGAGLKMNAYWYFFNMIQNLKVKRELKRASLIGQSPSVDSQCPGCLGQAVVTLRLPCAIVKSARHHKHLPFVNIAFLRSRSIKRRQWKHKMDYYGIVFAHLATECGINAKDPSGLDSDRSIPHSRCFCENPARAKALAGFLCHLSAGFTNLNPAPRGLSL